MKECSDCGRPFILDNKTGEYIRICDCVGEPITIKEKQVPVKERIIRSNMCSKKSKYPSEEEALRIGQQSLIDYKCKRDRKLRAYLCPYCHFWHLTHSSERG